MSRTVGIHGFACYFPANRVNLEDWCEWTGSSWEKISSVVGDSFRMCGDRENVYTMAANAVLRLVHSHDVDPGQVGTLALGTESSTDNSAGAVIVRGMVDDALQRDGLPTLSRQCEVPEFKHACLGGVYALKAALRYAALDGARRLAIVVSADIAEYARGSTGEPTQGAGAVAALVGGEPRLLEVDLLRAASASAYRGPDFRKPFSRFRDQPAAARLRDFPVFNGKYSTTCYLDETLTAMRQAFEQHGGWGGAGDTLSFLSRLEAVFLHRPYQRMPETGWAMIVLYLLAAGRDADRQLLGKLCAGAGCDPDAVRRELLDQPCVYRLVEAGELDAELFPAAQQAARALRGSEFHDELVERKLRLGQTLMRQVGNLYSGALPAWIAAGLEEAAACPDDLAGRDLLAIGYGSGDAAEVLPLRVAEGWRDSALRTGFRASLDGAADLTRRDYENLHDGLDGGPCARRYGFVIDRIGDAGGGFDDLGVEYYRYLPV